MPQQLTCPVCQSALPPSAPEGLCTRCLWASLLAPDPEDAAAPGRTVGLFGDYELLNEIARGGMGVVYRARQTSLNRVVALKMVLQTRLPGEAEMKRFRAEAEAVASLEHPNIVPIHEIGEDEGRPYFTMKYVPGGSLAARLDWLKLGGERLPQRDSARLIAKVARAVHHAHQRGILHRDLKPSNILLDLADEPLVTDFGLARQLETDSGLTLSGAVLGTPAYIAPEQAGGTQILTTAADVYSLGAILYELIAGRAPFTGSGVMEILQKVVQEEPVLACEDPDLETICLKCLQKNPAQRYASAEALAEDLERLLRGEPIRARPATPLERAIKWTRRHPAGSALLALGLLAPIVIIAVLLVGNARVHQANRKTRENLYAADMSLADRALREGNLGLARATLAGHLPAPGAVDLRGFEWRLLWQQSQGDQLRILSGFPHPPSALAISPDGQTLAIGGQHFLWRWDLKATNGIELLPTRDSRWLEPGEAVKLIAKVRTGPYLRHQVSNTNPPVGDYSAMVNPTRIDRVTRLSYSADGRSVLSSTRETWRAARVWNMADGTLDFAFPAIWSDAAMSPVAPIAAVGSYAAHGETGCVKLYDLERCEEIWALPETGGMLAFSGNGQLLATTGIDSSNASGGVWIWSLAEHRLVQHMALSNIWGTLAFSPDGRWVAGAGINLPTIEIWSIPEQRQAATLSGHAGAIRDLAFSPDSQMLASAGADQIVRLWSVPTGKLMAKRVGHTDEINSLAYFKDGQTLATASRDGTVRLWSTWVSGTEPHPFNGGGFLGRLEVSPDSRHWASTSQSWKALQIGDTLSGTGRLIPPPRPPEAQNEGFDDAGQTVVTSFCPEGKAVLKLEWRSVVELSPVRSVVLEGEASVLPIRSFCAAAGLFAQGDNWGIVRVWSTRTGKLLLTLGLPDHIDKHARINNTVNHVLISPDGTLLAAGGLGNSQISVFSLPAGKLLHSGHIRPLFMVGDNPIDPGNLNSITFSPDSKMLVSTDLTEPGLRLWEASTGRALGELSGHRDHTVDAAFSPDGRTLASTGADGSLKLWHLPTLREVATLLEGQAVGPVAFTSDGTQLLVGLSSEVKIFRTTGR